MPAAAAGPGTRVRRAGCIGPDSSGSSGFACRAAACGSRPAFPPTGQASRSSSGITHTTYTIVVENPERVSQGIAHADLDGVPLAGAPDGRRTGRRRHRSSRAPDPRRETGLSGFVRRRTDLSRRRGATLHGPRVAVRVRFDFRIHGTVPPHASSTRARTVTARGHCCSRHAAEAARAPPAVRSSLPAPTPREARCSRTRPNWRRRSRLLSCCSNWTRWPTGSCCRSSERPPATLPSITSGTRPSAAQTRPRRHPAR